MSDLNRRLMSNSKVKKVTKMERIKYMLRIPDVYENLLSALSIAAMFIYKGPYQLREDH
jgi:hypothetical protein